MTTQDKINDLVKKRDNARTSEQKRNLQTLIDNQKAFLKNENKGLNKPQKTKKMEAKNTKYLGIKIIPKKDVKGKKYYDFDKKITLVPKRTMGDAKKMIIQHLVSGKVSVLKITSIKRKYTSIKTLTDLNKAIKEATGLNAPQTKGFRTLSAKTVGVTGLRKKDGTLKIGFKYAKGGKIVKVKKPSINK